MSWAVGEIADLATKAARGAGRPWGEAEELGWAVRWLARCGLPGAEAAARILTGNGGADPLRLGTAIADAGDLAPLKVAETVAAPLLLLPFLGRSAPTSRAWRVRVGDVEASVWQDGTDCRIGLPQDGRVTVSGEGAIPGGFTPATRISVVAPAAMSTLQALAARTFAPATEESRARGAGAGLTDND